MALDCDIRSKVPRGRRGGRSERGTADGWPRMKKESLARRYIERRGRGGRKSARSRLQRGESASPHTAADSPRRCYKTARTHDFYERLSLSVGFDYVTIRSSPGIMFFYSCICIFQFFFFCFFRSIIFATYYRVDGNSCPVTLCLSTGNVLPRSTECRTLRDRVYVATERMLRYIPRSTNIWPFIPMHEQTIHARVILRENIKLKKIFFFFKRQNCINVFIFYCGYRKINRFHNCIVIIITSFRVKSRAKIFHMKFGLDA